MEKLYEYHLNVRPDQVQDLNEFCQKHNISYQTTINEIGDVTKNWLIVTPEDNKRIIQRRNTSVLLPHINISGLYAIGYGPINDPFDSNVIYIGESASQYRNTARTGVGQRIYMAIKDFIGMSSNHSGKFFNSKDDIVEEFNEENGFDLNKLTFAVRPHEEHSMWSKHYSHLIEGRAILKYEVFNGRKPLCNKMCGTNL